MKQIPWPYRIYQALWAGLDLLYPPNCGGCESPGARWCSKCRQTIQTIPYPVCEKCGLPMNESGLCVRCRAQRPVYDVLRSWGVFDSPLKEALHRMKYRRDLGLGEALARGMIQFLDTLEWSCDQIVPVPLAKRRLKERGYNQVALVAIPLALRFCLVYNP